MLNSTKTMDGQPEVKNEGNDLDNKKNNVTQVDVAPIKSKDKGKKLKRIPSAAWDNPETSDREIDRAIVSDNAPVDIPIIKIGPFGNGQKWKHKKAKKSRSKRQKKSKKKRL